jgi:hypothetical protein
MQRQDFDDFLVDRVNTIRVWRSVGGDLSPELENFYCTRGLEWYQSPELNAKMHSYRLIHVKSVMQEQQRQQTSGLNLDAFLIRHVTQRTSSWAAEQARSLGELDAEISSSSLHITSTCTSSTRKKKSVQLKLPELPIPKYNNTTSTAVTPFETQPTAAAAQPTAQAKQQEQGNVDVDRLKQMNRQFLQGMLDNKSGLSQDASSSIRSMMVPKAPRHDSLDMSRASVRSMMHNNKAPRHGSLDMSRARRQWMAPRETGMAQPFMTIRRDSLYGVQ